MERLTAFEPDVVTLDVNMPDMDGLTALSLMMQVRPTPTVMVSSLTERGAQVTFEALTLGAVDYVAKPGGTISLSVDDIATELLAKVRSARRARVKPPRPTDSTSGPSRRGATRTPPEPSHALRPARVRPQPTCVDAMRHAALEARVSVEDAEALQRWLVDQAKPAVHLGKCEHVHAAVLQVLLALRPAVTAAPPDPRLRQALGLTD